MGFDNIIYGIRDPRNQEVGYVGRTTNLRERIICHLTPTALSKNSELAAWIKDIIREGFKPEFFTIQENVPARIAGRVEQDSIGSYLKIGAKLKNKMLSIENKSFQEHPTTSQENPKEGGLEPGATLDRLRQPLLV